MANPLQFAVFPTSNRATDGLKTSVADRQKAGIGMMGGAYGFGFDDNLNQSSVIIDNKAPTHLIVTIPDF